MIFAIAFGVLALAFWGLSIYGRDLYAIKDGAALGGIVGQAQMHNLGVKPIKSQCAKTSSQSNSSLMISESCLEPFRLSRG